MSDASSALGEPRRKRVRKGTRSCWECKRRKIRCDFVDTEPVCAGCLDRGTKCVSQEYVDDQPPIPSGSQLGQQMGRVEMLLERLMEKVDANSLSTGGDQTITCESRESLGIDVLTPSSTSARQYDGAPILTLFDNAVFGRGSGDQISGRRSSITYTSTTASSPQINLLGVQPETKLEKYRRMLIVMLPSQHDLDILSEDSHGWFNLRRHVLPQLVKFPDHDLSKPFTVQGVLHSHPTIIARLLLCVALCIQQLPHTYDPSRLYLSGPLQDNIDKYITAVASITSDDELVGSMEGIECLALQGAYHINLGNIRRAWLCYRRGINVAQLMGLHRPSLTPYDSDSSHMASQRHYLWFQLVKADRFLSLVLGVPSSGGQTFPFEDTAEWLTVEDVYNKHLCAIAGLVLDRNQSELTHAFSTTQNIDERLDSLAKQMPSSWWEVPMTSGAPQTTEAAQIFDRVLVQIWHFELEAQIHLPFMLRAATDRRYEYSRLSCLAASRGLISRWLFLRTRSSTPLICRIFEFQALTSVIILLLDMLQPAQAMQTQEQIRQQEEDLKLVNTIKEVFEDLQKIRVDVAVAQSIEVLRTLQRVHANKGHTGNLRLTIPHFGTISVVRGSSSNNDQNINSLSEKSASNDHDENADFQIDPSLTWENVPVTQALPPNSTPPPVLSFTSSHFPALTAEMGGNWAFNDSDVLTFDSLINTDLEGNWNFGI